MSCLDDHVRTRIRIPTLMLLGQLSALQAGKIERAGPILTLPVTGQ